MSNFNILGIEEFQIYERRLNDASTQQRNLGWGAKSTTFSPTPAPTAVKAPTNGTKFEVYFKYTFEDVDNLLSTVDTILETMYSNMWSSTPAPTTSLFNGAKLRAEYFSYLGNYDPSIVEATNDYSYYSYYSYYDDGLSSAPTPEDYNDDGLSSAPTPEDYNDDGLSSAPTPEVRKTRSLQIVLRSRVPELVDQKIKSFKVPGSSNDIERKLLQVEKVNKKTGASCYIRAADTFLYPVIKDFGVGGTSSFPGTFNFTSSKKFKKGEDQIIRLDGSLFSQFPLPCTESNVNSANKKTKATYSDCKLFHVNVGFVFYPGVPANSKSTLKTNTNGKIFKFGESAFEAMLADPVNGDIATTRYRH